MSSKNIPKTRVRCCLLYSPHKQNKNWAARPGQDSFLYSNSSSYWAGNTISMCITKLGEKKGVMMIVVVLNANQEQEKRWSCGWTCVCVTACASAICSPWRSTLGVAAPPHHTTCKFLPASAVSGAAIIANCATNPRYQPISLRKDHTTFSV